MNRAVQLPAVVLCLAVVLIGSATAGDREVAAALDIEDEARLLETWMEALIDFDRLPGASIAVIHDQDIVYARGFGYADEARAVKATPGTVYGICSITKLFTSIAVMQLRDAGKLSLDDPVSRHLPWFEPEMASQEAEPPTIRDLLRHTSGLPCEPDHTVWDSHALLFPSREELIERVSHVEMSYPTNTEHNYSNLGYALLGEIVSVLSGLDYVDYVQKRILDPLGMGETTLFLPEELPTKRLATGYGRWPREGVRVEVGSVLGRAMTPAGGFASTAEDLARFAMWQFRVLAGEEGEVLSSETLREMHAEQWPDPQCGLGFEIWDVWDVRFLGKMGGCPGYKSQIILCPEKKIAVVVMVNATDAPQFTIALRAFEIMSHALGDSATEDEDGSREWEAYTGYYTADKTWSEAEVLEWNGSLAVMWVPTTDPVGSLVALERVEGDTFRQVRADGKLGKHYIFKSDAEGRIFGMKFNNNLLRKEARPD